ncbi:hypothetical protein KC343_g6210, partial [Hortaea werneckii]
KVPALDQAKHFFTEALRSLPSAGELTFTLRARQAPVHEQSSTIDDPFSAGPGAAPPNSQPATRHGSDDHDPYNYYSPTVGFASPSSPVDARRIEDLDVLPCSPQPLSRETSDSDLTDLESHSSFDQIMTPHRVLERDPSLTTTPNGHTAQGTYFSWLDASYSPGFTAKSVPRPAKAARRWKSLPEPSDVQATPTKHALSAARSPIQRPFATLRSRDEPILSSIATETRC